MNTSEDTQIQNTEIDFKTIETETLEEALTQAHVLLTPLTINRKPISENILEE